jgi:hypothetical protein
VHIVSRTRVLDSMYRSSALCPLPAPTQVIALREELSVAHLERDSVQAQLQKALAAQVSMPGTRQVYGHSSLHRLKQGALPVL